MSNTTRSIKRNKPAVDIEKLAAQARNKRQDECSAAVNKVLEEFNCQIAAMVKIGNDVLPVAQVINFPALVVIQSK